MNSCAAVGLICGSGYGNDSGGVGGSMYGDSESFSLNGFSVAGSVTVSSSVLVNETVSLFFSGSDSFVVLVVLIFVTATVSVCLDDEAGKRLSRGVSLSFEVKQEEPHSCTFTTKLDLELDVT